MNLQEIFENEPTQWGLRGDPHLWKEVKLRVAQVQGFSTANEFLTYLRITVEDIIGQKLVEDHCPYVQRFDHGGMSAGRVSCEFWLKTAFPLLVDRFNRLKN